MTVVVITPPAALVTLALAKKHLRVSHDDDDVLINAYIAAACGHIDGPNAYLGRAIGVQTLEYRVSGSLSGPRLDLPYGPVTEIASVIYRDPVGDDVTLDDGSYELADDGLIAVVGGVWPAGLLTANRVRVQYEAGFEVTPPAIVAAVLLMVGDLYANPETSVIGTAEAIPMSLTVTRLLTPYQRLEI